MVAEGERSGPSGGRPLEGVGHAQGGIDHEPLCPAEIAIDRIAIAAKSMDVSHGGPLRFGFAEHVGVTWIQTLDCRAFVSGRVRRDQVVA